MPARSRPASSAVDRLAETVFAALDRRLDGRGPVALALSGGGDSVALLHLAADWAGRRGRALLAFTVDHGLDPESGRWTREAGEAARALGLGWRALAWSGDKPATGLPAAARTARHALLARAAREAGARVLLIGHTRDDILEGELMRAGTPGLGRLTDWSPSPAWPEGRGVFLCRPLLDIRRAELRAWLSGRAIPWLDDPANDDPRYGRARARAELSLLPREAGEGDQAQLGGGSTARRSPPSPASPVLPPLREGRAGAPLALPRSLDARTLAAGLLCAAGTATPPRGKPLAALLSRVRSGERFTATLAGARIEAGEDLLIGREPGRRGLPSVPATPGERLVWDGRFELVAEGAAVVPVKGRMAGLANPDRAALAALPAWARPTQPAHLMADGTVKLAAAVPLSFGRLRAALGQIRRESDI